MIVLRFFYVEGKDKIPIKALRKEKAFVNESVPRIFAFLVRKEKDESRKPSRELWNGLKPKPFPLFRYPNIDPEQWFTYKKNGDGGKVKRVPLTEFVKEE